MTVSILDQKIKWFACSFWSSSDSWWCLKMLCKNKNAHQAKNPAHPRWKPFQKWIFWQFRHTKWPWLGHQRFELLQYNGYGDIMLIDLRLDLADGTFGTPKQLVPELLNACPTKVIRAFYWKTLRYMDAYRYDWLCLWENMLSESTHYENMSLFMIIIHDPWGHGK